MKVKDVMTADPVVHEADANLAAAARSMRDGDIGDVLVTRDGALIGLVTDRDIVVRSVASGQDPNEVSLEEVCSGEVATLSADASIDAAVELMRNRAVRRIPVCDGSTPVGVVSLGDLAVERDDSSVLADISAAQPNS